MCTLFRARGQIRNTIAKRCLGHCRGGGATAGSSRTTCSSAASGCFIFLDRTPWSRRGLAGRLFVVAEVEPPHAPPPAGVFAQSLPIDSRYDKNDVMVECRIANCGKKVQAKGLCSAHYARQRRGGDPSVKRKSGPKRDAARAIVLALFSDWSPRTQARYWKAHSQLQWVDGIQGTNSLETCIKACSRPNGSINVLEFERRAESIAAAFTVRGAPGQAPPPG
jgi:hypothetical protein